MLDSRNLHVSEIHISYSLAYLVRNQPTKIHSAEDAFKVLRPMYKDGSIEHRETFYALYMNQANSVLGVLKVSEGSISRCLVDVRIIFQGALKLNATTIILCHNHPTGSMKPSKSDIQLTETIIKAGQLLDTQILDHLIITDESYRSMANEVDVTF